MKKAYVKYERGHLVNGLLLVLEEPPPGNQWTEVPATYCCSNITISPGNFKMKGWIKFSAAGNVVPGSTITRKKRPTDGTWMEIPFKRCC